MGEKEKCTQKKHKQMPVGGPFIDNSTLNIIEKERNEKNRFKTCIYSLMMTMKH